MNSVTISGRLTATPELRRANNGASFCKFMLAVKRPYDSKKTDFLPCMAWRKTADFVCKYCTKGDGIEVQGYLEHDVFIGSDGEKTSKMDIMCEHIEFGPKYKGGQQQRPARKVDEYGLSPDDYAPQSTPSKLPDRPLDDSVPYADEFPEISEYAKLTEQRGTDEDAPSIFDALDGEGDEYF